MGKGLSILVKGKNFSSGSIGKINIPFENVVDYYLSDVGASIAYAEKLVALLNSLSEQGVLDSLDIYPLLGNSITNKCIPLNSKYFKTLQVGNNASNGSEGIDFTNTVAANISSYETKNVGKFTNGYIFVNMKRNPLETLGQSILFKYKPVNGAIDNGFIGYSKYYPNSTTKVFTIVHSDISPTSAVDCNGIFVSVSGSVQNSVLKVLTNGVETSNSNFNNESIENWEMNNVLGSDCLQPESDYPNRASFSGTVRMFAIGYVPAEKVAAVDAAFRAYFA